MYPSDKMFTKKPVAPKKTASKGIATKKVTRTVIILKVSLL